MSVGNFSSYLYVDDLPALKLAVYRRELVLRDQGLAVEADLVKAAYQRFVTALEQLSARVAVKGTEILREKEARSRVRPDTGGAGGPRLGDALEVEPISPVLAGSVGIANLDKLDALEDDEGNTGWWSVNEVGGGRAVGTRLYGYYEPGGAIPQAGLGDLIPRPHAIFQPTPSAYEEGGWMTIRKEAPARRFIEHSIPQIDALWRRGFAAAYAQFEAEMGI